MLDTVITLEGVRDQLLELIQESGITPDEIAKKMDARAQYLRKVNAGKPTATTLH